MKLNGDWDLFYVKEKDAVVQRPSDLRHSDYERIEALVPGNVELDLVNAGLEEDPHYAENTLNFMKYEYYQWWYTRSIKIDESFKGKDCILKFHGIDTIADIYLDDDIIGRVENMLVEHEFDITDRVVIGQEYVLSVRIYSVMNYIKDKYYSVWMRGSKHCSELPYIRKAPHMMGWDILPRLVSAGIWKDVELLALPKTRLTEVYYASASYEMGKIRMRFAYRMTTDHEDLSGFSLKVEGTCGDSSFLYTVPVWFVSANDGFMIDNPKLWYPKGYGEQPIYDVSMQLFYKGELVDSVESRIGLRVVRFERNFDKDNQEFKFYVNNTPIFINGTNHVALDISHSKDRLREQKAVQLAYECNCNMIRCWGGNVYPSDEFMDACDELGILVWQDFAFANSNYPTTNEFYEIVEEEAKKIIIRLRNHPSLVMWSGDNEVDAMSDLYLYPDYKSKYNRISREILEKAVQQHDPFRYFVRSSPEIPEGYNLYDVPEQHIWGARAYFKEDFYKHVNGKFIGEFGYHGCPSVESIKKYIPNDQLWPIEGNRVWAHHSTEDWMIEDVLGRRNTLMCNQVRILVGEIPDNLEDFYKVSQVSQAEAFKFMIERCRIQKWKKTGILWWNLLDGWPAISDAVVDYYFDKKLAYHVITRSQEPVCVMLDEQEGWHRALYIANDTNESHDVSYKVVNYGDDKVVCEGSAFVEKGCTVKTDEFFEIPASKQLYIIHWSVDGKQYTSHYMTGFPTYDKDIILKWYEVIKNLS